MTMPDLLTLWSSDPGTSLVIWSFIGVFAMYLGRTPAHQLILSTSRSLRASLRLTAVSIGKAERRLAQRNKEVILNTGREATERAIEREFHRVNAIVDRDLSGYPSVHRQITDAIERIEKDYQASTETPPSPPAWLDAIDAIAKIPRNGDSAVEDILTNIHGTIEKAHDDTLKAYRKNSLERLQLLKKMLPSWRRLSGNLANIDTMFTDLKDRAAFIDKQMQTYEQIQASEDRAARLLTSSSLTQFFISALVLVIAILGGVINFQLIALPMSEMVGGTSQLGGWRTADIAALVIIMIEVAMGLFLLESLRITRLFPVIGSMDDKMRKRMMVITIAILAILASVEASLAYMRDLLALDKEALTQSLAGVTAINAEFRWIPSIGQMTMGFILPFALAFVAIPLESFIHSFRTVIGLGASATLRSVIYVVKLSSHVAHHIGRILVNAYDLIIFLPLRIEQVLATKKSEKQRKTIPVLHDKIDTNGSIF